MDKLDHHAQGVEVFQRRTTARAQTYNTPGDNVVHTPASGKYIVLQYLCLSADGQNSTPVLVAISWEGGAQIYKISLVPGAIWARNIGAGRRVVTGDVGQALKINLSAAQSVHYNEESEEY